MIRRIVAVRESIGSLVTTIEFVVGIRFLMGLFSDETVGGVREAMTQTIGQMDAVARAGGAVGMTEGNGMDGPTTLLSSLGFVLLGSALFLGVPKAARRRERRAYGNRRVRHRSASAGFFVSGR